MKIYKTPNLFDNLSGKFIFFDNDSLFHIITYEELFASLLTKLKQSSCAFLTIPSVSFEFSRTNTIEGFNKRASFIKNFLTVYPIEEHVKEFSDLILVLQKINGTMSYSDFLLYCCLYKFPDARLFTANHNDFHTSVLDRNELITVDNDTKSIKVIGVYSFSKEKYNKAAQKILQEG